MDIQDAFVVLDSLVGQSAARIVLAEVRDHVHEMIGDLDRAAAEAGDLERINENLRLTNNGLVDEKNYWVDVADDRQDQISSLLSDGSYSRERVERLLEENDRLRNEAGDLRAEVLRMTYTEDKIRELVGDDDKFADIKNFALDKKKINAIKLLRPFIPGGGLKEAKDIVEALWF